MILFKVISCHL